MRAYLMPETTKTERSNPMNKLIIAAALASLIGGALPASANPAHHTGAAATTVAPAPMHHGKHHAMHGKGHMMRCKHGAGGMHGMMGSGGMDHQHMQQMHDHMSGGMMGGAAAGGGAMGDRAATATPTPAAPN
jgi:hypothetical protein